MTQHRLNTLKVNIKNKVNVSLVLIMYLDVICTDDRSYSDSIVRQYEEFAFRTDINP